MRGFILQPTYRIEAGRPVVHLYGVLEDRRTFLVRDTRHRPHFFVRAADAWRARVLEAAPLGETGKVTMQGEPVLRVEVPLPSDMRPLSDRLHAAEVPTYEADVRFALRPLIDLGIRGAVALQGRARPGRSAPDGALVDLIFDDPEMARVPAGEVRPGLTVLSLDIETDPAGQHLLSIALHGCGASEVLLLQPRRTAIPDLPDLDVPVHRCGSERDLLLRFAQRVRELDPDVLTGWNVIDFDLAVLCRAAARERVALELGRAPGALRVEPAPSRFAASRASLPGRVVLDGIQLLRGAFILMEDYSLDAVAQKVLGQGKLLSGPSRADEILHLYRTDLQRFCRYNLTDARLALEILERLRLFDLTVERSLLTGMPPDRVAASIASFDFLYLSELSRRGVVAPTLLADEGALEPTMGGHVLDPRPGLYRNVVTLDYKSLYPSLIRTFQIDPLGHCPGLPEGDVIVAPSGAAFRRESAILPRLLDTLFERRAEARRAGDAVKSHAIKILMNSFYGVLGTPACRFYSAELANAITSFGKLVLLWSKEQVEQRGHEVLYGDTDSLFVLSGAADADAARRVGERLVAELNQALAQYILERYRVPSRLELEFETLYLRLYLPRTRGGEAGARKRYAGLVQEADGRAQVVFTGMEVVRRDWTRLARQVQRALYERLFADQPGAQIGDYLRQVVADLRAGRYDDLLVYRKALRKELASYTENTPPHVAAARKLPNGGDGARVVAYVMTTAGPEPAEARQAPLDHEHYVQKQLRPVAEPVLALLGLSFDRVVGDERQLELFS